jgi:hypothetical protein
MGFSDFERAGPSAVKSIKQRDLLSTWLRLRSHGGGLPRLEDYQPARFEEELPELMFYDVVREGGVPRFLVVKDGARLIASFGFSGKGKFLEDIIDPKLWAFTRPIYFGCVDHHLPVYSAFTVIDLKGCPVLYERLLLPFGQGSDVQKMIASLKSISWEGSFENRDLMRPEGHDPKYVIRAIIDPALAAAPTKTPIAVDDVVEI